MTKKQLESIFIISVICKIGIIIEYYLNSNFSISRIANVLDAVISLFWIITIIKNSNIRYTYYFKIINLSIAVLFIGGLFKIMHWEGSSFILTIGVLALFITYIFRFTNKPSIQLLDILKMLWLLCVLISTLIREYKITNADLSILSSVIFYVMAGVFVFQDNDKKLHK